MLSERRGALAAECDAVDSVERVVRMGSVSTVITPATLRPYLIETVERGIRRTLDRSHEGALLGDELPG